MPERKFLIGYDKGLAPGDYAILTPLIRDLKAQHGDRYAINVKTDMGALFMHNRHLTPMESSDPDVEQVVLCYKRGMEWAKRGHHVHFTQWMYQDFFDKTGVRVRQTGPRCDFHLTEAEKSTAPISGRYWLIMGGGKTDFITKHWDFQWYQDVVNMLRPKGLRFAQTGSSAEGHVHPRMHDVLNIVGWGYLRELLWQIYHCEGVICPITCGMHIASAFDKPCVVIAGGREEPWWEHYSDDYGQFGPDAGSVKVPHRFLHTVGQLDCCETHGCWTNKLKPTLKDSNICKKLAPREKGRQLLPMCMDMIQPKDVIEAVMSYYEDGTLPPPYEVQSEPQILATQVPWQPIANHPVGQATELAPRRAGLRWSHPKLGGKVTVCVFLRYANKPEEHLACLRSIIKTVPRVRLDLRIGTELCTYNSPELNRYLTENCSFAKTFTGLAGCGKQELMSEMLQDLDTRYAVWIDGNAKAVHDDWLNLLGDTILKQLPNAGVYGLKRRRDSGIFVFDSEFFAIRSDAIDGLNMAEDSCFIAPDRKIVPFNTGKSLVFYPSPSDNPD